MRKERGGQSHSPDICYVSGTYAETLNLHKFFIKLHIHIPNHVLGNQSSSINIIHEKIKLVYKMTMFQNEI